MNRRRYPWYRKAWNCFWQLVVDLLRVATTIMVFALVAAAPILVGMSMEILTGFPPGGYGNFFLVGSAAIAFVFLLIAWVASCWKRGNNPTED